jgi:quercetin dioxygenase-like cupin family protein
MDGHTYLRTHDLEAEHMVLDLGRVVTDLHAGSEPGQARRSVTLVKQGGMSIVLTHLHEGSTIHEHQAPGAVSIHVLDGLVHVHIGDEEIELRGGRLIAFNSGVRHSVEAIEESTLLLTLTAASADTAGNPTP